MCCLDVQVMRGSNCWTDHHMMRAKLRVLLSQSRSIQKQPFPSAVHPLAGMEFRDMYVRSLEQSLADGCPSPACLPEEHWNQFQSSIVSSSEGSVGRGYRSSPEWFEDSVNLLRPLNDKKNEALQKWLQRDTRSCKHSFHRSQQVVQKAVNEAKEEWIAKVASEAEAAFKDGGVKYYSIHA